MASRIGGCGDVRAHLVDGVVPAGPEGGLNEAQPTVGLLFVTVPEELQAAFAHPHGVAHGLGALPRGEELLGVDALGGIVPAPSIEIELERLFQVFSGHWTPSLSRVVCWIEHGEG